MPRKRQKSLPIPENAPTLTDLHTPLDGIVRLPQGAVSCTFQADDSDTNGLVVRLADGTGAIFCKQSWGDPSNGIIDEHGVLHQGFDTSDTEQLDEVPEPEGDTPAARSASLAEIFWSDLNPSLEDPYLSEGALSDSPLEFRRGDEEAFAKVIRWAVACCPAERVAEPLELVFRAEGADESAEIDHDCLPDGLDVVERVAEIALEHFGPMGEAWEYNDGAYGRQSGYSNYQASFSVLVEPPSAHARIEARSALAAWLRQEAGRDEEDVAKILGT